LYEAYQERLKILNAADFGDLLLENIRLFREQPEVLRQYQQRFKYILVDEYQDTNVAQYLWLRLIAQRASAGLTPSSPGRREAPSPGDPDQAGTVLLTDRDRRVEPGDDAGGLGAGGGHPQSPP